MIKNRKNSISADLTFVFMLVLLFGCVVFSATDTNNFLINFVAMSVVVVMMIITYFYTIVTGLVIDVILLFAALCYTVYLSAAKGFVVGSYVYFWCALLPLTTVAVGLFSKSVNNLEKETTRQQDQLAELATIDDLTGLKNQKAFIQDAEIYIHIANRYNYGLICMIAGYKYPHEVQSIIGKKNMETFNKKVSDAMVQKLRKEDQVYIIDREKNIWGLLLFNNNPDSAKMIIDRMKEEISEIGLSRMDMKKKFTLEMRFGVSVYSPKADSPMELLNRARKEMEYDV